MMESEFNSAHEFNTDYSKGVSYNFLHSLAAGAVAGLVVDIVLFPIDTIKTRLQCEAGFWRSGGFSGIYKGLVPTAAGSAPTAALFFCAYDSIKKLLSSGTGGLSAGSPYTHMLAASSAEVGVKHGLYRGFGSTIAREIPFSLVQFPLWEFFKQQWTPCTGLSSTPVTVALCGAMAGGIGAAVTTPLDVVKTRIMLAETKRLGVPSMFKSVYRERGVQGLFAGILPRVTWITLGGAFFFGFYDLTIRLLANNNTNANTNTNQH